MTPTLRHQILSVVCHYLNTPLDINLQPISQDRWATYCPVHEADRAGTPSLHVYVGKHSITGQEEMHFRCVSQGCKAASIVACLERDGLQAKSSNKVRPRNLEVNIPPHAEPEWETRTFNDWPVTDHWAFLNIKGEIIYWHIRADNPNKVRSTVKNPIKKKQYSRIYSVTDKDTGKIFFAHSAPLKEKPIPYNAYYLQHRLQAPVLIVEGPKTADAAAQLYPDYVILTWDEGGGSFNKFDWSLLHGRDTPIILFPDNDDPGILSMRGLAKILISMDLKPRITHEKLLPAPYPEGWDLADSLPKSTEFHPDILINDAEEVEFSEEETASLISDTILLKRFEEFDSRFALVLNDKGEYTYYDTYDIDPFSKTGCPYRMYNKTGLRTLISDKYMDQEEEEELLIIDTWMERPKQILYTSLTYDPSTTEKTIKKTDTILYLNIFTGFITKPIESKPEESEWFLKHLINLQGVDEARYSMCYIADIIQNPGKKPGTMMLWAGTQGNGKSYVGKVITRLLGPMNAVVLNAKVLADQFTAEYASKMFVMAEEMPTHPRARENIEQELKYLITTDYVRLNSKGVTAYQIPSYHRIILTSNNIKAMKIDEDERRTTIFECKSAHLKRQHNFIADHDYFNPLFRRLDDPIAMGKLMYYLQTYKIEMDVSKPFSTEVKESLQRPKDPAQAFIEEILDSGVLPVNCQPLGHKWPNEDTPLPRSVINTALQDYCTRNKISMPSHKVITETLLNLIPPRSIGIKSDRRFEMVDKNDNTYKTARERIYEFINIHKHRKEYEEKTKSYPTWSEIDALEEPKIEETKESNVIPLRPKDKGEDVL